LSEEDSNIEGFENVRFFLKKLQHFLNDSNCQLDIQRGRKGQDRSDPNTTINTMLELEYNSEDIKEELLSLKTSDYIKTVRDKKRPESSDYWVFSKKVKGRDIYIKLKIYSVNKIHLMSFHYPNFAIEDKPYK
jgi:hypothetical protein